MSIDLMDLALADPKGLVRESYAIEGITAGECRSIFLDWALSLAETVSVPTALRSLIAFYAVKQPGHPMNAILDQALAPPPEPKRKGGRMGRISG